MLYPEFRCAKIDPHTDPLRFPKRLVKKIFLYIVKVIVLLILCCAITCLFKSIYNPKSDGRFLDLLSIGASFITIFAAFIAAVSLLDALSMRKYKENIYLLEDRYLEGKKQSSWNFFKRYFNSRSKDKNHMNYMLISATFMLYEEGNNSSLEILVPFLAADFHDVSCIRQIIRLKKFMPKYHQYLEEEDMRFIEKTGNEGEMSPQRPFYFFPLPQHLIAIYTNILLHKIYKILMLYFSALIIFVVGLAFALAI